MLVLLARPIPAALGSGMGIVPELVFAHDGRIDMHIKSGDGSGFTATLPGIRPRSTP
jgi:signal transduction histidine kinase